MPKLFDMWDELKKWLELQDSDRHSDVNISDVLDKMDELEYEYE